MAGSWRETTGSGAARRDLQMAHDHDLADRIRELLVGVPAVTEKRMFGGLAFLVGGRMAITASGRGGVLVRVDPAESDALVAGTPARPAEMRGRTMAGWLRVDAEDVGTREALSEWVKRGVAAASALASKR